MADNLRKMDSSHALIDGISMPLESPSTVEQLADRVRQCAAEGVAVYPIGGGRGLDFGRPPARSGLALNLSQIKRVVDYPVDDLTITVESGMTLAALQQLLATNKQRLPIDVPFPEEATVGGAISVDAAGGRRLGYGTWRDRVIGITVVNDRGELCSAGGRVVKNVAGYDLCKLYTGSMGSFGIITQVTLKLQPEPADHKWICFSVGKAEMPAALAAIIDSKTRPVAAELLSIDGEPDRIEVAVLFEDNSEAVAWQTTQLIQELPMARRVSRSDEWNEQISLRPPMIDCSFRIIASIPPSSIANLIQQIEPEPLVIHAHALNGFVRLGWRNVAEPEARLLADRLLKMATTFGGNSVIRRCPSEWKSSLPIWGRPPTSLELMKKVKSEFDPFNILNPGRTLV